MVICQGLAEPAAVVSWCCRRACGVTGPAIAFRGVQRDANHLAKVKAWSCHDLENNSNCAGMGVESGPEDDMAAAAGRRLTLSSHSFLISNPVKRRASVMLN